MQSAGGATSGVAQALAARRSCRNYRPDPLPSELLNGLIDQARRAPTAGNCQGVEFLVLDQPDQVAAYWEITLSEERKKAFPWPGLLLAPALVVPYGMPSRYLERYREPDKATAEMGENLKQWPVPYWLVDGAAAAMALQLLIVEAGLACCFFGQFSHEKNIADRFGVPQEAVAVGTLAIGYAADDRPSKSTKRPRRPLAEVLHNGRWGR